MRYWIIGILIFLVYFVALALFGFAGPVAYTVHFTRLTIIMAQLILYIPYTYLLFTKIPAPNRDFLMAGTILYPLSNTLFSVWNEFGRIYGVDTSVFTSWTAGLFSLIAAVAGLALLRAADTDEKDRWIYALIGGVTFGVLLVVVAPQFR